MREAMVGQQRSTTLQIKLQPYRKRPIRFLGRYEQKGWHIKLYGISSKGEAPNTSLVVAAKALCQRELPQPAREEGRYGVAVLIVHEADDGNYVLIDWWVHENMLHHCVYAASLAEPERFMDFSSAKIVACIWELAVLSFERQAWIDSVLAHEPGPDLERYLEMYLIADV